MRAIVIFYEGDDIPQDLCNTLAQKVALFGNADQISVVRMCDEEVSAAILSHTIDREQSKKVTAHNQSTEEETIEQAMKYIDVLVLQRSESDVDIIYNISNGIAKGDEAMRSAVEIIGSSSFSQRKLHDLNRNFSKNVVGIIQGLYKSMKK